MLSLNFVYVQPLIIYIYTIYIYIGDTHIRYTLRNSHEQNCHADST